MEKLRDRLCAFLQECRGDMHEPDEQGISAVVVGDHLDNAYGTHISEAHIVGGFQEYVVILKNTNREVLKINLADLIALARQRRKDVKIEKKTEREPF